MNNIYNINKNWFYVYEHYIDNKIFYVGKGKGQRAYEFRDRGSAWMNRVKGRESEIKVKIVAYFEKEEDAYFYEENKIKYYCVQNEKLENVVYNNHVKRRSKVIDKLTRKTKKVNESQKIDFSKFGIKTQKINHLKQISQYLNNKNDNLNQGKIIFYNRLINSIEYIKDMAIKKGYNPLILINSSMNSCQLKAFDFIVENNKLPEEYDFLISDILLCELNLKNENIDTIIINTTNNSISTELSNNLINDNVNMIIYRTDKNLIFNNITVNEKYINKHLTSLDKSKLCEELNMLDDKGRLNKWPTVKKILQLNGYEIVDKKIKQNGKQIRVSIITKP